MYIFVGFLTIPIVLYSSLCCMHCIMFKEKYWYKEDIYTVHSSFTLFFYNIFSVCLVFSYILTSPRDRKVENCHLPGTERIIIAIFQGQKGL